VPFVSPDTVAEVADEETVTGVWGDEPTYGVTV
jgi:hypothetical protein